MTNGIIQEVFNSMKKPMCDCAYCNEIESKKQELIEKVEQKRVWQWDAVRLRDLIGDNQE